MKARGKTVELDRKNAFSSAEPWRKPRRPAMTSSPLAVHLGIVLILKSLLLGCLWLVFVHPDKVPVDPAAMAARAGVSAPPVHFSAGEQRE